MKLTINGEAANVSAGLTVSGLLTERTVKMPDMVTVELNGEILRRERFAATALREGDRVEFLYFMGGGATRPPSLPSLESLPTRSPQ
jgi:sulfur carrier protein